MMISRRPNRRASIENLPGPKSAMASSIVAARMIGSFASNKVGVVAGRSENPMTIEPRAARILATGVRNPTNNNTPVSRAAKPINQVPGVDDGAPKYNPPWTNSAIPITARSSSRPIPGHPPGKAKKNRWNRNLLLYSEALLKNTSLRVVDISRARIPLCRNLFVTLSGDDLRATPDLPQPARCQYRFTRHPAGVRRRQKCCDERPAKVNRSNTLESELYDSAAHGDGNRLCAVLGAEFVHDVLDVHFDGFLRDKQ